MGAAARSERAYMRMIFKENALPTRYERKKSHVYKRGSAYILDRVRLLSTLCSGQGIIFLLNLS